MVYHSAAFRLATQNSPKLKRKDQLGDLPSSRLVKLVRPNCLPNWVMSTQFPCTASQFLTEHGFRRRILSCCWFFSGSPVSLGVLVGLQFSLEMRKSGHLQILQYMQHNRLVAPTHRQLVADPDEFCMNRGGIQLHVVFAINITAVNNKPLTAIFTLTDYAYACTQVHI